MQCDIAAAFPEFTIPQQINRPISMGPETSAEVAKQSFFFAFVY